MRNLILAVLVLAFVLAGCARRSPEDKKLEAFAAQAIKELEPDAGRVNVQYASLSPDHHLVCGMTRIGPVRLTPFLIDLDQPYPQGRTTRVVVQSSIDRAIDKPKAQSLAMVQLGEIMELCAAEGIYVHSNPHRKSR